MFTTAQYDTASTLLSATVARLALSAQSRHDGIVLRPALNAPDTYPALCEAYASGRSSGVLPIYSGASGDTIYRTARHNIMFRFWHDLGHIETGLSFVPADEMELQHAHHLPAIESAGIERGSLPWMMYRADTVGQIEYVVKYGAFPEAQSAFVRQYVITDGKEF